MTRLTVPPENAGQRLDAWLHAGRTDLSRSRLQALIRSGHVTVNGRAVKPHLKLPAHAIITLEVPPAAPVEIKPEPIPLDILHEDADIVVVNKPAGLVVHPAAGHASGTLVNALLAHCRDLAGIGGELRPGIVHRLDRDTSGVLVVAKNEPAMQHVVAQFRQRKVKKEYLTVVWGALNPGAGRTETLIGRSSHDRKKMSARPATGRPAVTFYETLEVFPGASLLRVRIETGRTHQIRVHMAYLGHPVVGDAQYGRARKDGLPIRANRQMLHAERLTLIHPRSGQRVSFAAPIPPDMRELLERLRRGD
jgi:23S rRNA pseudouridine1911/1915/1917 synthase